MPEVLNDGVKISYDCFGVRESNKTILFLSGAGNDGSVWHNQVSFFKERYFVITIDNRGSGKSDCPDYKYSAHMLAKDVKAVLQKENIEKVFLAGFSMGGLVAQKFTDDNKEMVERLVLMNCSLGAGNKYTVLPKQEVVNMFLFAAALSDEDACKNAMDYNFGPEFKTCSPVLYERYYNETMANRKGLHSQIAIMVSTAPLIKDYAEFDVPVLYILSTDDPVTPKENGEKIKNVLPAAQVEYVDGFHASMLNHPDTVNRLIDDFLDKSKRAV